MFDFISPTEAVVGDLDFLPAAPRVGRSLGGQVAAINRPVRNAVGFLSAASAHVDLVKLFDESTPSPKNLGGIAEPYSVRSAWLIVSAALLHARSLQENAILSLEGAVAWFTASKLMAKRLKAHYGANWEYAESSLRDAKLNPAFWALLPYVLEPDGHVTRSEFETCEVSRERKTRKRSSGAFYTPGDVANFMASAVVSEGATWFDPACGTGVFLRAAIENVRKLQPELNLREFVRTQLHAVDLSALSTDLASVVVMDQLLSATDVSPVNLWREIKRKVVCADAQKLRPRSTVGGDLFTSTHGGNLEALFGERCANGFDIVIMNPPYSASQVTRSDCEYWETVPPHTTKVDAQIIFTEMMWRFTTSRGVAVAVLPLSVGANTSSGYTSLRREISRVPGRKTFLFFDREPQALFGEDIKTRNAILLVDKRYTRPEIYTSGLLKWSAEQRASMLTFDRATPLGRVEIDRFIPKVSTDTERAVYVELLQRVPFAAAQIKSSRVSLSAIVGNPSAHDLFVTGTAYNFLNVFRADGLPDTVDHSLSSSPVNKIPFADSHRGFAALAVLASRLMFWLWHVEGDGFHVSAQFIERSPLWALLGDTDATRKLASAGRQHWSEARRSSMLSVNGGRATFSFHAGYNTSFYSAVDRMMLDSLGIKESTEFLDRFIANTVHVGGVRRDRRPQQVV